MPIQSAGAVVRHGPEEGTVQLEFNANHFQDKDPELAAQEKYRYERFLGTTVEYTEKSFEEFADDPFCGDTACS